MRVLSAEVLRLRAQCPPTAEVEAMRDELARLRQAIGLMSTAKPDMLVDVRDPVGMARQVVEMVERMRQDWLTTFQAVTDQKKRAEKAEAIAEQNGKAATERGDLIERLRGILFCTFPAGPTLEDQAKALVAAAKNGAPPVVSYDRLFMVHLPGEWSSSADEFFVYRRVSNTPWVTVHWRHGPGVSNSDNNDHMAIDTFLRRCGVDMSKAEGLPGVHWVRAAADCVRGSRLPGVKASDLLNFDHAEAQSAVAAIRDLGPELAKAGIQVGPRCSHAEAVAQLRGERDRWREKCEAEQHLNDSRGWLEAMRRTEPKRDVALAPINRLVDEAIRKVAERARKDGGADPFGLFTPRACQEPKAEPLPFTGSDLLPSYATKRKRFVEELRQVVNRNSIEHACGDTPDFILAEVMVDAALSFGRFTRGRDAHATGRAPKLGPATSQPRTEVPIGPDGSGTVVELGEAFREAMRKAGSIWVEIPVGEDLNCYRLRHLHAAVAELARVVERAGAR